MAEVYDGAGFTVKEMLVRLETKVDVVLADHEKRLREIENNDAVIEGGSANREKFRATIIAWIAVAIAAAGTILEVYLATT